MFRESIGERERREERQTFSRVIVPLTAILSSGRFLCIFLLTRSSVSLPVTLFVFFRVSIWPLFSIFYLAGNIVWPRYISDRVMRLGIWQESQREMHSHDSLLHRDSLQRDIEKCKRAIVWSSKCDERVIEQMRRGTNVLMFNLDIYDCANIFLWKNKYLFWK